MMTDIEKALAKKVINIIIKSLEDSWNTIIPVTGKFISLDDNYQSIQVATAGEIVALLTFEVQNIVNNPEITYEELRK